MSARPNTLAHRLVAEGLGTAFLLTAVVGSGIMGDRLAGGNVAIALLANTIATGAALVVLIVTFISVSGAHFNPAVTLSAAALGAMPWREVPSYVVAQLSGGLLGVAAAHAMFGERILQVSTHVRASGGEIFAEVIATLGLVLVIWASVRRRPSAVAWVVGGYITAAYWFTSSTSFANPAVTISRLASDTFAGIRPADVPAFIAAQLVGAAVAVAFVRFLYPVEEAAAE